MIDPVALPWFHGRITRDAAEECLQQTSMDDGIYLLRESVAQVGYYVLSVCKDRKIVHYQIKKHQNGKVGIADGPQFDGPVELVRHHEMNLDGLLTKLTLGCSRPAGVKAEAYRDISHEALDEATREALRAEGIESEEAVVLFKGEVELIVGSILHKKQPWFHGVIPRDEADRRLQSKGSKEGMFLVRERGGMQRSYVLGLCHSGKVYHYLFEPDKHGKLAIKSGRSFDNLMAVVNFYYQKSEGLLCTLKCVCDVTWFEFRPRSQSTATNMLLHPEIQAELRKSINNFGQDLLKYRKKPASQPRPSSIACPSPGPPPIPSRPENQMWRYEKIYDVSNVKMLEGFENPFGKDVARSMILDTRRLTLQEELGHGNFGSVMKGIYELPNKKKIAVAVKTLKEEDIPSQKSEIMREAEIMMSLDHPNIVRLVGITQSPGIMIVMELAPQGPLHKYLKKHHELPVLSILILMLQVDEGMQYLEQQHFVHRDLAARNVLVVSQNFVKISDFGMSRAMGAGNEYYRAERAGKWPLKWYAPECIYYRKFTSKGDVWSYGITMWEAVSYGSKPYQGLKGPDIVELLDKGYRPPSPRGCPPEIYALMHSCWEYKPERRPSFADIGCKLSAYIEERRVK